MGAAVYLLPCGDGGIPRLPLLISTQGARIGLRWVGAIKILSIGCGTAVCCANKESHSLKLCVFSVNPPPLWHDETIEIMNRTFELGVELTCTFPNRPLKGARAKRVCDPFFYYYRHNQWSPSRSRSLVIFNLLSENSFLIKTADILVKNRRCVTLYDMAFPVWECL